MFFLHLQDVKHETVYDEVRERKKTSEETPETKGEWIKPLSVFSSNERKRWAVMV